MVASRGMRSRIVLIARLIVVCLLLTGRAVAQTSSAPAPAAIVASSDVSEVLVNGATEWMIGGASGVGVGRRLDRDNSTYVFHAMSWGRILTAPVGPAFIRGRFEWALEVVPIFAQYRPGRAYGAGISPLVWRWNLDQHGPIAGFGEVAGGGLWSNTSLPEGTAPGNFTAHVGVGLRFLMRADRGVVLTYRLHHISNGNRVDRNPGVNAHVVYFGWTLLRPPRPPRTREPTAVSREP